MAAHRSRHRLITDFLDASILDEDHPDRREPALNLYDPANPDRPPYPPAFITKYRQAQVDRNRRITARVLERLESLRKAGRPDDEYCFTVQGTMADLRWVDPAVDPNDREAGTSYLGEPRLANDSTAGLARYSSLRGWLSQWALDHAQVDAVEAAPRITVPTLVIANSKDNACPVRHSQDLFAGLAAREKQMYTIPGANHYFSGPSGRDHLDQAVSHVDSWLETLGFAA
jgi:pimeloyl-ACP methyl ester carboxylesterase